MIQKLLEKISNLFDSDKDEVQEILKPEESREENIVKPLNSSIQIIDFVREIERYYREYIFHSRSMYINGNLSDEEAIIYKRKIEQYQIAISQIGVIRQKLVELERVTTNTFGTESYSFAEQLKDYSLKELNEKSFEIAKHINSINVIPKLDEIILNQLKIYQTSWNLEQNKIPENTSLRIIKAKDNIEFYQFGKFEKEIISIKEKRELQPAQVDYIKNLKINFSTNNFFSNKVWVRCTSISRRQLDFLKKSTIFPNDWEAGKSKNIIFDIVDFEDLDYYIKSILQLIFTRNDFVMITIINPTNNVLTDFQNIVQVDENNREAKVTDDFAFWMIERTGKLGENLQFKYLSSKDKLSSIDFRSYSEFISKFHVISTTGR